MPRSRTAVLLLTSSLAIGATPTLAPAQPAPTKPTTPQATSAQPAKVADTIEQRVLACAACHGKQGEGITKNEYYPRLAGKPAGYLFNQLVNFREKKRESKIMTYLVAFLSDEYLYEMAEYYSKLNPPFPQRTATVSKETLERGEMLALKGDAEKKIPACAACHGQQLAGLDPGIPGLVGLYSDYIAAQLGGWKSGKRKAQAPDCMHTVVEPMSPSDIVAVSAWLAVQPAAPGNPPPAKAGSVKLPLECGAAQPQPGHKPIPLAR